MEWPLAHAREWLCVSELVSVSKWVWLCERALECLVCVSEWVIVCVTVCEPLSVGVSERVCVSERDWMIMWVKVCECVSERLSDYSCERESVLVTVCESEWVTVRMWV
jgi:hypothetical protein